MSNDTEAGAMPRCLNRDCESENVDVVDSKNGYVHISCNDCGWLHRDVLATTSEQAGAMVQIDLTDLKMLHRQGYVEKGGVHIEASEGCSERLQDADDAGVNL